MAAISALTLAVPTKRLLDLARAFRTADWLSSHSDEIKTDCALDHTTTQIMKVVVELKKLLVKKPNMQDVGDEIIACVKPFITIPMTHSELDEQGDDIFAQFGFTPKEATALSASDKKVMDGLSESVRQVRDMRKDKRSYDNLDVSYYALMVYIRYSPQRKLFDFYYAYVNANDRSIWQWAASSDQKKKRLAALEVESLERLGKALIARSDNRIVAKVTEEGDFEALVRDLQ